MSLRDELRSTGVIRSFEDQTLDRIETHKCWEDGPQAQLSIGTRIELLDGSKGTIVDRVQPGYVVHLDYQLPGSRVTFQPFSLKVLEKAQYPRVGGI